MSDVNKLWVHVSRLGDSNLFAIYPRILEQVMEAAKIDPSKSVYDLILPSDSVWREKIYYKLVYKQRQLNLVSDCSFDIHNIMVTRKLEAQEFSWQTDDIHGVLTIIKRMQSTLLYIFSIVSIDTFRFYSFLSSFFMSHACRLDKYFDLIRQLFSRMPPDRKIISEQAINLKNPEWDTRVTSKGRQQAKKGRCIKYSDSAHRSGSAAPSPLVVWFVGDIAKAARLLTQPPLDVQFSNEHEMRRVYSLIYDVFRYKNILNQALNDVNFYQIYPEYKACTHVVWLLSYELYCRRFRDRSNMDQKLAVLEWKRCAVLKSLEGALWNLRVKLAASISRLRIAHNALNLNDMLPVHLRDEKVNRNAQKQPLTAWVNKFKVISPVAIMAELNEELEFDPIEFGKPLVPKMYSWDTVCPMILNFHHSDRMVLAQSQSVREHKLILQDRSFSYGPAMFCKLLFEMQLSGTVVMTHVTSPRAVGYFAALLSQNENVFSLLAFGAGDRKPEFDQYLHVLGIDNSLIYMKNFFDMDMNAEVLENVVAIYSTPPNSHSAVADPVDLVCGRGGDLLMLELLTDDGQSNEGEKRIARMLEEQRLTLATAMSRPQVQFVLYETHSQIPAENHHMVNHVVKDVNLAAKMVHAKMEPLPFPNYAKETREINNNNEEDEISDTISVEILNEMENIRKRQISDEVKLEETLKNVKIPETDEFVVSDLPDLCFNSDSCVKLKEEGCYLAFIKRKEVINLNSQYMIKMAESRGLFGAGMRESSSPRKSQKTSKNRKRTTSSKTKRKTSIDIERIAAQTVSSTIRSFHPEKCNVASCNGFTCPRHKQTLTQASNTKTSPAKQWWAETTRYLTRLKKSLVKQKIISNRPSLLSKLLPEDQVLKDIRNIDEVLNRVPQSKGTLAKIPPFPKLKLTRQKEKIERDPLPIYNYSIQLPQKYFSNVLL